MKNNIKELDFTQYFNIILNNLKKGILITAKNDNKINPMTISWGNIGIKWNKWFFVTYVRTGRFTHEMLKKSGEFTVNIPLEDPATEILNFCGSKSGRDYDKVKELGLTPINGINIKTPGLKELPLTLECKIIYSQLQDKNSIPSEIQDRFYPSANPSSYPRANQDFHTLFFGEILGAYIIE